MIVWCKYSLGEGTFMKQGTLDEVVGVFIQPGILGPCLT